jgi:hypothetical protein
MQDALRRKIFQEDYYNQVFSKVMETAAGVTVSHDCTELIVRYLQEFEGLVTGAPIVFTKEQTIFGESITGYDPSKCVVFTSSHQYELKSGVFTSLPMLDWRHNFPLIQVGNHMWEIREGQMAIFRRSISPEGKDLPALVMHPNRCRFGCGRTDRWFQSASTYHDPVLQKMVVAVKTDKQNVTFFDPDTGIECAPEFDSSPYSMQSRIAVIESKLALVHTIVGWNESPSLNKLIVYDFKTRSSKESPEFFLDVASSGGFQIHTIRNRICLVSVKLVSVKLVSVKPVSVKPVSVKPKTELKSLPDILVFDDQLRLINEIYHGYRPNQPGNQFSFVVENCLYLFDVSSKSGKHDEHLVVKLI